MSDFFLGSARARLSRRELQVVLERSCLFGFEPETVEKKRVSECLHI